MKMKLLATGLITLLLAALPTFAGSNWQGGGEDDYWSNTNNWDDGTLPTFPGVASFGTTNTTRLSPSNDLSGVVLTALNFSPTFNEPFTLVGNGVTLTNPFGVVQFWANPPTLVTQTVNMGLHLASGINFNTQPNGDITVGGVISGTQDMYKNNGGNLTLKGANTFTGQIQVRNGTLKLGANNTLNTNVLIINPSFGNTGTVDLMGKTNIVSWMAMAGGGNGEEITDSVGGGVLKLTSYMSLNGGAGPATWSCTVDLNGGFREFFVSDAFSALTVSGSIINSSGTAANLVKQGVGTMILSGTNTYNGTTTINNGTLQLDYPGLPAGTTIVITNPAVLNLNYAGTNLVSGFTTNGVPLPVGVYDATSLPGFISGTGAIEVPILSAGFWDGGGSDANWSTGANWDNNVVPVFPKALTFVGPGGLVNTNDLTGKTVSGITFNAAAGAFVIRGNAITNAGNVSFTGNPSSPITQTINLNMDLGGANRTITTQPNGNIVLGGVISGANTLFKNNSGTLTLSGANNFSGGAVQVRNGTLKLGANEVIPGGITLNPTSGTATLDLNGRTETVSSLTFANSGGTEFVIDSAGGGLLKLAGNLFLNNTAGPATISANLQLSDGTQQIGVYDATSTLTVSGPISGSSGTTNLVKLGVGTLIFAGTNTYQCDTRVNQGTLQLNLASLGATNAVYLVGTNGAVLNLNFSGTNLVSALYTNGVPLADGVYNAANLPGLITGGGALKIGAAPASTPGNLVNVALSSGSLIFSVTNTSGTYRIQANTNLANAGGWVDIATNTAPFSFTNSVSAPPQRFFRTVTP